MGCGSGSAARMRRAGMTRRQVHHMPFTRGRGSGSTIEYETLTVRPGAMVGVAVRCDVARPFHIRNVSLRRRTRRDPADIHRASRDGSLVENACRPCVRRITCETIRRARCSNGHARCRTCQYWGKVCDGDAVQRAGARPVCVEIDLKCAARGMPGLREPGMPCGVRRETAA